MKIVIFKGWITLMWTLKIKTLNPFSSLRKAMGVLHHFPGVCVCVHTCTHVCVKLIYWKNISSTSSCKSAKKRTMTAATSCHLNPVILPTSGWFLTSLLPDVLVSCRKSLKHLSVLNEQPSSRLEDVFVEDKSIGVRSRSVSSFPPGALAGLASYFLFPRSCSSLPFRDRAASSWLN